MVNLRTLGVLCLLWACRKAPSAEGPTPEPPRDVPRATDADRGAPTAAAPVTAIFAGGRRSCAIRGGALRCWGHAAHGSLGSLVTMSQTSVPTAVPGLEAAVEIALGEAHACARLADGSARCVGSNEYGALGDGGAVRDSATAVAPRGLGAITQIAAGGAQSCAITGGKVACWGDGYGTTPVELAGTAGATQIALGAHHGCVLIAGAVRCWGRNDHGQRGDPDPKPRPEARPVAGLAGVDQLAAGGDVSCARTGGKVACWGAGRDAVVGDPDRKDTATPRTIDGLTDARAIAVGARHACALRSSGEVACRRGSDRGAFGYPRGCPEASAGRDVSPGSSGVVMVYCAAAMPVAGITDAVALAHGEDHACALERGGALRCWGGSGYGELGNRDRGAQGSRTPVEVGFVAPTAGGGSAKAIAVAAAQQWSCAVLEGGTVKCWGNSSLGQLGPAVKVSSATPVAIAGITGATAVAMGRYHACALLGDGSLRCWGHQVGAPVAPVGLPPVNQVAASASSTGAHTCARTTTGEVWCWGANAVGQAQPGGPQAVAAPTRVAGITGASLVAVGDQATCVVTGGVPRCWGALPTANGSQWVKAPTPVAGIDHVVELGLGAHVFCARKDDDTVWCWGHRRSGVGAPQQVALGGPVATLVVGDYGAAAVRRDGKVMQWWIEDGTPPKQAAIASPQALACSGSHCCALDAGGAVACWGENLNGQLGNPDQGAGGSTDVPTPVRL